MVTAHGIRRFRITGNCCGGYLDEAGAAAYAA
jgi:hypothetical protein